MARLQILELPEGTDDVRPPYVLVVDETMPQRVIIGMDHGPVRDYWSDVAERIGARAVIVTPETVEIPANDLTLPEPAELVAETELRFERDEMRRNYEGACKTIADMHAAATGRTGMGPVRGVVEDVEDVRQRAEQAEAGRVAADDMLRAVCEVFGGPHVDPVVKARKVLARAEQAEAKLQAFTEAQQKEAG
ncbi:hypothetical protein [Streptomyces ardesiacus]|uniref:hypothetical protein n=1 Tax=Streptomyces ardesiacus TaxID=285564 RepID=UPI00363F9966